MNRDGMFPAEMRYAVQIIISSYLMLEILRKSLEFSEGIPAGPGGETLQDPDLHQACRPQSGGTQLLVSCSQRNRNLIR